MKVIASDTLRDLLLGSLLTTILVVVIRLFYGQELHLARNAVNGRQLSDHH